MSMDDHSFELMMSKLNSIESTQSRLYLQFNERMDRQDEKVNALNKEVSFAKGVAYVLSGGTAFTAWVMGFFK